MRLRDYAASKAVTLCFLGIGALALAVFLLAAGTDAAFIAMAEGLLLLLAAGWLMCGWAAARSRLGKLRRTADELQDKYLLGEVLPPPHGEVEIQYFDVMKAVSRSAIGLTEQARRDKEDYCAYVESWIHEIKTPLTACSLILAGDGDPRKLRRELKRADNLTESILWYARMRTAEKDTVIQKIQAASVMEEAVKSQKELLIAAGNSVEITGDFTVSTDGKALCFILKQLLINCAKYAPGCRIALTAEEGVLTVEDAGPGIPAHELPRVTERGFTGARGREAGGSTGMGLYIVRGLCSRLGIDLDISSQPGAYTRVSLAFRNLTAL